MEEPDGYWARKMMFNYHDYILEAPEKFWLRSPSKEDLPALARSQGGPKGAALGDGQIKDIREKCPNIKEL
jgi:hypothetical protein